MDVSVPLAHPEARPGLGTRLASGDERLAEAVGRGDRRAFEAIYERYHQPLYRYCRSILRNDADAQDALQTAMVGAFVALENGRRDAPLRPWLFRIAHNAAISAMRRRHPTADLAESDGPVAESVEMRAEERHRLALLVADLAELPERQRGALVMRELSGLSHEDIALALGITVGAAKQSIFEARRSLLEFREGREIPCESIQRAISDRDGRVIRSRRVRAHLRECVACTAFAEAIEPRRGQLAALAPPLAPLAASGLLARLGGGHAGGLAASAGAKSAALAVAAKTAAAVVVLAGATVAVTRTVHLGSTAPTAPRHGAVTVRPPASAGGTSPGPATTGAATPASSQSGAALQRGHSGSRLPAITSGSPATIVPAGTVHFTTTTANGNHANAALSGARGNSAPAHANAAAGTKGNSAQAHTKSGSTSAGNSAQTHTNAGTSTGKSSQAHGKTTTSSTTTTTTTSTASTSTTTSSTTSGSSGQPNGNAGQPNGNAGSTATNGPTPPGSPGPGRHTS